MVEYGFDNVPTGGPGIAENLLQVNVYFKSLNVRTVVEAPVYEKVIIFNENISISRETSYF